MMFARRSKPEPKRLHGLLEGGATVMDLVHRPRRWARLLLAAVCSGQRPARRSREDRRTPVGGLSRGRPRATLWSVVALVLVATLTSCVRPVAPVTASAEQLSLPSYLPLMRTTDFGGPPADDPNDPKSNYSTKVLLEISITLQAGEKRRVFGRLEATSSSTPGSWLETGIWCLDSAGNQSGTAATTGTNHEGYGGAYSPPGHLVLYPSLLFTAPSAGTYKCQLAAGTGDPKDDTYHATAVKAGSNPALGGTWLQASSSDELGAQWWQNPDCDSGGTQPTCSYVGGSTPPELWIFQNDGTHLDFWEAARNATAASVSATVTLTTCYHSTRSCTDDHKGSSDGSTVSTHLELVQLTPGLGICRVNTSPDVTYAITGNAHHYSIHYELDNVPISATCGGSRLFEVYIDMKQVAGNPVKIDGTRPGPDGAETDAIAFDSAFAATVPVPNVLSLSETAARQAIATAGLAVGAVSYAVSSSPTGTVIVQNSPGGTVEPAHSPVNLIVSHPAVTVPDVLGSTQSEAVASIGAAFLVVGKVSSYSNCLDPGTVRAQNPAGGTTAGPGSAVNITVTACNDGHSPK
jgi:hypothetical protein